MDADCPLPQNLDAEKALLGGILLGQAVIAMQPDAHQVAALVPMPRLLEALGFAVNERTCRCACLLHGGSNPTAFAWTEGGLWHCFSCGAGGDRIALVRAVRRCTFREAARFLAQLAGVSYAPRHISRRELETVQKRRERAERGAWTIADRVAELRARYHGAMLRADRLCWRIGERMERAGTDEAREEGWTGLARVAPAQSFFTAAWGFFTKARADVLARAAFGAPAERRRMILGEEASDVQCAAA